MSHEVESMAWANEVPWHGLGAKVEGDLTYEEMLVAAGLDWTVSKRPYMFARQDGTMMASKSRVALVRDSDDAELSSVGTEWNPVQNREALRFFDQFSKAGHATLETAGSLRGGKLVWGLARLGDGFVLPGGDAIKGYVLLANPHEGGKAVIARTTPIRVVCANTMAMAFSREAKFEQRFSHVREFNADEAAETFGYAREQMNEFQLNAQTLQKLNLSWEDAIRVLAPVYQPQAELADLLRDEKEWSPSLRSVLEAYTDAPGAVPETGWGLLNGVTYHADHKAGKNNDSRLASAWLGTEAKRKEAVMTSLLEMAA